MDTLAHIKRIVIIAGPKGGGKATFDSRILWMLSVIIATLLAIAGCAQTSSSLPHPIVGTRQKAILYPCYETVDVRADGTVTKTSGPDRADNVYTVSAMRPLYPRNSRKLGEQGKVVIKALVKAAGRPTDVKLYISSGYPRLDEAALAAVSEWEFKPVQARSQEATECFLIPISYRLETTGDRPRFPRLRGRIIGEYDPPIRAR